MLFHRLRSSFALLACLCALTAIPAAADVSDPFLVEDVNDRAFAAPGVFFLELAETTLVIEQGEAAWSTDGTPAGTRSLDPRIADARFLARPESREVIYFRIETEDGADLFVTDGSPGGLQRLTTGGGVISNNWLTTTGRLYFVRRVATVVYELWISDGTAAGTRRVDELTGLGQPTFLNAIGDVALFEARSPGSIRDTLYRTDGTAAGTFVLAEISPQSGLNPRAAVLGGRAVFPAFDETNGNELWVSDGTVAGTTLLADLNPGPDAIFWGDLLVSGNRIFASYRNRDFETRTLVVTDGTTAGTREIVTFPEPPEGVLEAFVRAWGDGFVVFDGWSAEEGTEPWVSDENAARPIADLCLGPCSSEPFDFRPVEGGFYFQANDGVTGRELYFGDGSGARRVADLCAGSCRSHIEHVGSSDDTVFFTAVDADGDRELYRSSAGGPPVRLTDLPRDEPFRSFQPSFSNGFVFFSTVLPGGSSQQIFAVSGDPSEPPARILDLDANLTFEIGSPRAFATFQGDLVFLGLRNGLSLYRRSPGEPSRRLDQFPLISDFLQTNAQEIHVLGNRLIVVTGMNQNTEGQIWASDGTRGGAQLLLDDRRIEEAEATADTLFLATADGLWVTRGGGITRIFESVGVSDLSAFGDRMAFLNGDEVWLSDGTAAGTIRLVDPVPQSFVRVGEIRTTDTEIYFTAQKLGSTATRLYATDTSGNVRAAAPADISVRGLLGVLGDRMIFYAGDNTGIGLWAAGTTPTDVRLLLQSFRVDDIGSPGFSARLGSELWFVTTSGAVRTDGTPEGTRRVPRPDPVGSVESVHAIPGHLLLYLSDPAGTALWVTDGTDDGTRRLDIFSALGGEVHTVGNRSYFAADGEAQDDPETDVGLELWAVDLGSTGPPPPPPGPPTDVPAAPRNLRAEGLPEAVRLTWTDASDNETRFVIQGQPANAFDPVYSTIVTVPANTTSVVLDSSTGFEPLSVYLFRVRAESGDLVSAWSEPASASPVETFFTCTDGFVDPTTLCLRDGRFTVHSYWRVERDDGFFDTGRGTAVPFDVSEDSGTFWFFDPDNIELVVKVLDARPVNGFFWNFYGALSDVEYWIVVTDTQENTNATYYNPPQELCGQADVRGFPRPDALAAAPGDTWLPPSQVTDRPAVGQSIAPIEQGGTGVCVPDADTLCLTPDRYRVTVDWRDQRSGDTGVGHAIPGTSDSGYFWFFDPANVELVVKVLDARTVNGFVWVFYGALTDVEYTLTVTDTETGATKQYVNPPGNICGNADVRAFQ